ncbi:MAG: hypothetical protein JRN21_09960 [Nitrososphaerota archaeon]|nr:hypothetical protein [Nitrososphaerota archaeon]
MPEDKPIDMKAYVLAPPEIMKAVDDLFALYQLQNQYHVEAYEKWKGKNWFKGSMAELIAKDEMEEVVALSEHKPWQTLIRGIYLVNNVIATLSRGSLSIESIYVPVAGLNKLSKEQRAELLEMVTSGAEGYDVVKKWLEPINKKGVLDAIYDAVKVKVGTGRYDQFHVMKMGSIKTSATGGFQVFDQILEIDNPEALVEYLKASKNPLPQSIMVTFVRNKKRGWKSNIFLFFLWKDTVYILDAGDRRLNLDNTHGDRNPGMYLDDKFKHVWLPFKILLGERRPSNASAMVLREQKVFMRGSLQAIFAKEPALGAWLQIFLYHVADYIQTAEQKKEIPEGTSTATVLKALEDKSAQIEVKERVKTGKYSDSFSSSGDASSYLIRKYGEQVKSIVPATISLPTVLGDRKYVEQVVAFKQRENIASAIEKLLWDDWKANHDRVYKWWNDFIRSQDLEALLAKALENRNSEYPVKVHPDFGGIWIAGKHFESVSPATTAKELQEKHAITEPTVVKTPVVGIHHGPVGESKDQLTVVLTKTGKLYDYVPHHVLCGYKWTADDGRELFCTRESGHRSWEHWHRKVDVGRTTSVPTKCPVCDKNTWKSVVSLDFNDWLQFCAFFGLEQSQVPKEFIDHFHLQNEAYTGNTILEDIDPVDLIRDPWFRTIEEKSTYSEKEGKYVPSGLEIGQNSKPRLTGYIPICNSCFKSRIPESYFLSDNVMHYYQRPDTEWGRSRDYYGHYTSFEKFANDVAVAAKGLTDWYAHKVSRPDVLSGVVMSTDKRRLSTAKGTRDKLFVESEGKIIDTK